MSTYQDFLASKSIVAPLGGFDVPLPKINKAMRADGFQWQAAITRWALKRGKAALFEDCGLGKTIQESDWASHVAKHTDSPVLIFAPLAVASQTHEEGRKFGIPINICESALDIRAGINITNYQKLHKFHPEPLGGIVLDESSILKGMDGATRKAITEFAANIPYRLCATATPSPNDHTELGNHAEFLGVMKLQEMLSMFFVHDGGDTSKWRLKGHAQSEFWKWVSSWAIAIRRPSDLGYEDGRFHLPKLNIEQVTVAVSSENLTTLFPVEAQTLDERRQSRRDSLKDRVKACADLANNINEPWLIWCNLNAESVALTEAIEGAVEVTGSDDDEFKEQAVHDFVAGRIRVIVSKPTIAGYGLNLQHCRRVAFVGLSDSYEQYYQAIRRCWRFGQAREVFCYVITAETEGAVVRNIERKERQASEMMEGMVEHMKNEMKRNVVGAVADKSEYKATQEMILPSWASGMV